MVVKRVSNTSVIRREVAKQKSYIVPAFFSSLTIHPLNVNELPESYIQPIIYLMMISLISSIIATGYIKLFIDTNLQFSAMAIWLVLICLSCWVFYTIVSFVVSLIGCMVIERPHSAKHYGVSASTYTWIPVLVMIDTLGVGYLSSACSFGVALLMIYYVQLTYRDHFPYHTDRSCALHRIFISVVFLVLSLFYSRVPLMSYGLYKQQVYQYIK